MQPGLRAWRRGAAGLGAIAVLGVAGCGSGSGSGAAAQSGSGASSTPDASATPTPGASASAGSAKRGARTVPISGFAYHPVKLVVKRGTKVTWVDKDAANHTVTFKRGPGNLGNVDPGKKLSARFTKPGTYSYVCQYHPNMHGTIVVK